MDYSLAIEGAPEAVPGGSAILLVHPSTVETDRYDTQFFQTDTDALLIVSTRTTAPEVRQKLEHYGVDDAEVDILDTLSVERGYTRRQSPDVTYLTAPDDLPGIVDHTREFLEATDGKRRVSVDSLTELIYYADQESVREAASDLVDLLDDHDAVGLFHLARGVHGEDVVANFRDLFDGVVEVDEDGDSTATF